MTRAAIGRRRFLLGGTTAFGTALAARSAAAQNEYAVFTEFSPANKLMVPGWNRRIFTDTDARKGDSIKCDFATGVVSLAPGANVTMPVVKSHWMALPLWTSVSVKTRRFQPGLAGLDVGESSVKTA